MASYQHPRTIQVHIIDRSNPLDVVAVEMKATGGRKKPRRFTMIREIRDSVREHGYWSGRADCVLLNIWSGSYHKQLAAYPTWSGEPRGEAMEWLTDEEIEEARAINRAILATLDEYPEMAFLLSGRREDGQSTREWVQERIVERREAMKLATPIRAAG